MKRLFLRYQRELTVFAGVLIATGGFAFAAFVSEGSKAVGEGTFVVSSNDDGLLVTGEVVNVTTNASGKRMTVVRWRTRQGQTVTEQIRTPSLTPLTPLPARPDIVVTEPGVTIASPTITLSDTETVLQFETVSETQTQIQTETVVETQIITETVVVTETTPGTVGDPGGSEIPSP